MNSGFTPDNIRKMKKESEKTDYTKSIRKEFGNIDDTKYHNDPRVRNVWCKCGEHHAHVTKEEYELILKGENKILFDCGKADL